MKASEYLISRFLMIWGINCLLLACSSQQQSLVPDIASYNSINTLTAPVKLLETTKKGLSPRIIVQPVVIDSTDSKFSSLVAEKITKSLTEQGHFALLSLPENPGYEKLVLSIAEHSPYYDLPELDALLTIKEVASDINSVGADLTAETIATCSVAGTIKVALDFYNLPAMTKLPTFLTELNFKKASDCPNPGSIVLPLLAAKLAARLQPLLTEFLEPKLYIVEVLDKNKAKLLEINGGLADGLIRGMPLDIYRQEFIRKDGNLMLARYKIGEAVTTQLLAGDKSLVKVIADHDDIRRYDYLVPRKLTP